MEKPSHKYWWIDGKTTGIQNGIARVSNWTPGASPKTTGDPPPYFSFHYRAGSSISIRYQSVLEENNKELHKYVAYAIGGAVAFHYDLFPPCLGCTFWFPIVTCIWYRIAPRWNRSMPKKELKRLARSSFMEDDPNKPKVSSD
jgi:hypothetical protein